jgi:hypothetical protein
MHACMLIRKNIVSLADDRRRISGEIFGSSSYK